MKLKKLALVLAIVLMASTLAPALAKSPFSDVNADHWAYDSIAELAAAGLVEGYPDGTFGGQNNLTRYEAAMVFSRALNRLEAYLSNGGILPELDKIKAEIVEEVLAQAGGSVETTIVERVVVDAEMDEETLERLRNAEIANEAVQGDLAYLEARVLGLIDGIRYDVNRVQEQLESGVEPAGLDEIEELIAAKIEEAILEAAIGAKETVIVNQEIIEKVGEDALTEEEVNEIVQNAMTKQFQLVEHFIVKILKEDQEQNARLDVLEEDMNGVKDGMKELQKVQLSGSFNTELENNDEDSEDEYLFSQSANLNLNIKASDTTNVKASIGGNYHANTKNLSVDSYRLEVDSESPINKFIAGKLDKDDDVGPRYNGYVFGGNDYGLGGIADLDIAKGLSANILVAGNPDDEEKETNVDTALALTYEFADALNLKADLALSKDGAAEKPAVDAFGAKVFGDLDLFGYEANFALDNNADEDNTIFDVSANADVAFLSLDGQFITAQKDYGINRQFAVADDDVAATSIEAGAGLEFLGIDLSGRYYTESDADDKLVNAAKVEASREFTLGLPIDVSAGFVWNKLEENDDPETQITASASFAKEADLGLSYGAGVGYVKNEFQDDKDWKNGLFKGEDNVTLEANLGYKLDWRTALVSLGYDLEFGMPVGDDARNNTAKHELSLGYDFTDSVGLTAATIIDQEFAEPETTRTITYKAGFSVEF